MRMGMKLCTEYGRGYEPTAALRQVGTIWERAFGVLGWMTMDATDTPTSKFMLFLYQKYLGNCYKCNASMIFVGTSWDTTQS